MDSKVICRTWSDSEAELIRGLLESYGIPCSVISDITHSVYPLTVNGLGEIRLSVPTDAAEEAERILAEYQTAVPEESAPPRGTAARPKGMAEIVSRAPTRIDLAGGTLDIWPLSLLVEDAATVNVAIDLEATARLTSRSGGAVRLRSLDQGVEESYPNIREVRSDGRLGLLARLALELPPPSGFDLETESAAPAGSGLGGSSALGIAVGAGLARLRGEKLAPEDLLRLVQSVETQVLRVPTGVQDYYPALQGGVLSIRYGPRGTRAERIGTDLSALQNRLVLCFSGASRSSGVSNWDMLKGYLDNDSRVVEGIGRVALATHRMESALRSGDLDEAAVALGEEWEARKTLSRKVSSEAIELQMTAAREAGALAGKVCGAGGGGCVVFLTRPGCRGAVRRALESRGARILPARLQESGLRLEETEHSR